MSSFRDDVPMLTPEEQEHISAAAEEAIREATAYCEWLRSPEGRAWVDQELQEARTIAEEFKQDCAAGKFGLSADELAKLRRDAEAFAEEVRTGKFDLSHHKKAGPLSDRRAVLEYRGLRVLGYWEWQDTPKAVDGVS